MMAMILAALIGPGTELDYDAGYFPGRYDGKESPWVSIPKRVVVVGVYHPELWQPEPRLKPGDPVPCPPLVCVEANSTRDSRDQVFLVDPYSRKRVNWQTVRVLRPGPLPSLVPHTLLQLDYKPYDVPKR